MTELNRNPINPQIDDLHNTSFGRRYNPTGPTSESIRVRFEYLLRLRARNDNDQTTQNSPDLSNDNVVTDVRFYCTSKRIEKNKDGTYRNKDRNINYKPGSLSSPGGRFANCFDFREPTLMITMTIQSQYSEVQICPWFLTYIRGFKYTDLSSPGASIFHMISKIAVPVLSKRDYAPIDAFCLMDKTIVHELMHTDQIGQPTVDLQPDPYGKF